MVSTQLIAAFLTTSLIAPPAPAAEGVPPAPEPPSEEVQSVFDMGLDAPPPPPPQPRTDQEGPQSVFDMGLEAPPPPPPPAEATRPVSTEPPREPEPAPTRLRQAGWGLLIGGFALVSMASLSFGLAERERSRTRRISLAYDLYGNSPRPLPGDIAATLVTSRQNRTRFSLMAAGFAGSAALVWIVSGVVLGVARKRRRSSRARARLDGTLRF